MSGAIPAIAALARLKPGCRHSGTARESRNGCCLLVGLGDDRHVQAPADYASDVSNRHALVADPVIPGSRRTLLEDQTDNCRRPACRYHELDEILVRRLHRRLKKGQYVVSPHIGCRRTKSPVSVLMGAAESGVDL